MCGGGVVETPLSQYTPEWPIGSNFGLLGSLPGVPGYTVFLGWVFLVKNGFFSCFFGFFWVFGVIFTFKTTDGTSWPAGDPTRDLSGLMGF